MDFLIKIISTRPNIFAFEEHPILPKNPTSIWCSHYMKTTSLIAKLVKNLPAMQESSVGFLGQEDPLEKGWAAHSSTLGLPLCAQNSPSQASAIHEP